MLVLEKDGEDQLDRSYKKSKVLLRVIVLGKIAQLSVDTQFVFIAQQNGYYVRVYKRYYTFQQICTYQCIQCDIYTYLRLTSILTIYTYLLLLTPWSTVLL